MSSVRATALCRSLRAVAVPQFRVQQPVRGAPAVAQSLGAVALAALPLLVRQRRLARCEAVVDGSQTLQERTESGALKWYASTDGANYAKLNSYLRGGRGHPEGSMDRITAELDELIDGAEPLSEDAHVYRGLDSSLHRSLHVGDRTSDPAFMSTSRQRGTANFFARRNALFEEDLESAVVFDITVPAGFKALQVADRSEGIVGEQEVLLPRGTELEIVKEEMWNGVKILEARVVVEPCAHHDAVGSVH